MALWHARCESVAGGEGEREREREREWDVGELERSYVQQSSGFFPASSLRCWLRTAWHSLQTLTFLCCLNFTVRLIAQIYMAQTGDVRENGSRLAVPTMRKEKGMEVRQWGQGYQAASAPAVAATCSEAAAPCTCWHSATCVQGSEAPGLLHELGQGRLWNRLLA